MRSMPLKCEGFFLPIGPENGWGQRESSDNFDRWIRKVVKKVEEKKCDWDCLLKFIPACKANTIIMDDSPRRALKSLCRKTCPFGLTHGWHALQRDVNCHPQINWRRLSKLKQNMPTIRDSFAKTELLSRLRYWVSLPYTCCFLSCNGW
jgi:hypothetical protein